MNRGYWWLFVGVGAGAAWTVYDRDQGESIGESVEKNLKKIGDVVQGLFVGSRGLRNNNPGNIRRGANWQGMAAEQTDDDFVVFTDPLFGIRAMSRILSNYAARGVLTVEQIISTWAPPNENDTGSYIRSVLNDTGWSRNYVPVKSDGDHQTLIKAIVRHENGKQPYSDTLINDGINLA